MEGKVEEKVEERNGERKVVELKGKVRVRESVCVCVYVRRRAH